MNAILRPPGDDLPEAEFAPMTPERLDAVMAIEATAYPHPWTRGNFSDSLRAGYQAQVLVAGDTMTLPKDGVAKAGFELAAAATSVRVDVLDKTGAVVDNIELGPMPAGLQTFQWDGSSGTRTLDPGLYKLRVTALDGASKVSATTLAAAPVQAVTLGTGGATLQLGAAGSTTLDKVRAIL